MERKTCPYCGEEIAVTAKKCRFCGEWLEKTQQQETISNKPNKTMTLEPLEVSSATDSNDYPVVNQAFTTPDQSFQPYTVPGSQPGQTIQSIGGQPIVFNVVNQQSVEQSVEQTVIVENSRGSSEETPNWIFCEIWFIAGIIGAMLKSWWWFLGIALGGSLLLMIPFIGAVMCVALGLCWGILGGAIGATFMGKTAGWIIGILVGMIAIYAHYEARKANMESLNED
ncbi:MAG: hypothetical protein K2K84_00800 [Muribaculaceae bacterium]|nr:hypothetical protein [Muribaculaceae bacterium]